MRFAPTPKNLPAQVDQLDKAGETILQLVHEAAGVAEQNSSRALYTEIEGRFFRDRGGRSRMRA